MPRPTIILKEILSNQEWELIRTVYMLRIIKEEEMKQKLGERKFASILSKALRKIFENEEATDYLRRYTDQDVFQRLSYQNAKSLEDSFLSDLENPLTKAYLSSLSHEKQIVAQYYLGIGTCQFCNVATVIQILNENHITKSYGDITNISQEILKDMRDPKYCNAFLILANQYCSSALIHRIHSMLLEEKKEQEEQKVKAFNKEIKKEPPIKEEKKNQSQIY